MDYKLLILDLDGTTVAPSGASLPSQRVIDVVSRAQDRLHVAVATGRPYHSSAHVFRALGLSGPGVVNGGSEIVEMVSGEVLYAKKIDVATQRELVKLCLPFGYKLQNSIARGTGLQRPSDIQAEAEKFFINGVKVADSIRLLDELAGLKGVTAHPSKSWAQGDIVDIHVTHKQGTKSYGVNRLIKMLGLKKEQVIAIGDDHNDVPLLMAVGTKVAMADAPAEVKAIADFVTSSLEDDGVARAIDKFIMAQR